MTDIMIYDYMFTAESNQQWNNCVNARRNRCQEDLSFPFGKLKETTRMPSYYMDEDYPARPEIQQSSWMKQLTWLRIIHSGDWCLRLALRTPGGACHRRSTGAYLTLPVVPGIMTPGKTESESSFHCCKCRVMCGCSIEKLAEVRRCF